MPRPVKRRRVCCYPHALGFVPVGGGEGAGCVILSVDEYEAVRLIDKEGLSQEICAEQMQVARTTVTKIYETARRKLAEALVEGRPLRIEGGEYRLCDGKNSGCAQSACPRRMLQKQKGETNMKVAATYLDGQIFQHFGRTEQFKVYNIEDGKVTSSEILDSEGAGHGALAELLKARGVEALICGGIGGGARMALEAEDIAIYGGVSGSADEAAEALAEGRLSFTQNETCGCHGHDHHHHDDEKCECGHHHHEEEHHHHHHHHDDEKCECGHHHHEEEHHHHHHHHDDEKCECGHHHHEKDEKHHH